MIVIGSFAVPLSTMVLFMEANVWRNVSMYTVIKTFFVGGCASLVATLLLFSFYSASEMDFFGAFMVGVIEELGKGCYRACCLTEIRETFNSDRYADWEQDLPHLSRQAMRCNLSSNFSRLQAMQLHTVRILMGNR